ncbi:gene transfer agent family protein [Sphingobium amiense]|uniref:Gene transfer agent family protein n=1 Tax=Sphingobium amiense TaxID=135719 RepID=A0A494W8V8_9SPHN|nr:gene transfer agent family protein [Sphingobium amiense]BBD96822.1 gene transfer agent family protein [Sphingobium amiense]
MSGAANPAPANPERGEAALELGGEALLLRPSFGALVAAEQELGPLFEVVERAAEGRLSLGDLVALFWHCLVDRGGLTREALGEAVVAAGIAKVTPALKSIVRQILAGT